MLSTVLEYTALIGVLVLGGAFLGAVVLFMWKTTRESNLKPPKKGARAHQVPYLEELGSRIAALETKVDGLPSLWDEVRDRAKKQADRSAQAVRDLEARLESVAVEHEPDADVLADDVAGGGVEGVFPMLPAVEAEPVDDLQERASQALAIFGRR